MFSLHNVVIASSQGSQRGSNRFSASAAAAQTGSVVIRSTLHVLDCCASQLAALACTAERRSGIERLRCAAVLISAGAVLPIDGGRDCSPICHLSYDAANGDSVSDEISLDLIKTRFPLALPRHCSSYG